MVINQGLECPICKQDTSKLFTAPCDYRKPKTRTPYDVYWCFNCSYGQVLKRPNKDEVAEFYNIPDYYTHNTYKNTTKNDDNETFLDKLRLHLSWRFDKGEELSPSNVIPLLKSDSLKMIEIGCGNGNNMNKFANKGFSTIGIEPDSKARKVAKEKGHIVYKGTAEELPNVIVNKRFDVVLMSHVLEHCLDINAAILNAKNLLTDEGVFIVETPNCESLGFKTQQSEWPWSDIPRHLNFFTVSSLKLILLKHGFSVVTEKYRGFCRQFSNSWLQNEKQIWRVLHEQDINTTIEPNYKLRAWNFLVKSLILSKSAKYDSVRIIAKKI